MKALICILPVEGEGPTFRAKRWDGGNRADLIESVTPCHDTQAVRPYQDLNQLRLTILAAILEDYTTAPQHLDVTWLTWLTQFGLIFRHLPAF